MVEIKTEIKIYSAVRQELESQKKDGALMIKTKRYCTEV